MKPFVKTSFVQKIARVMLGAAMTYAGVGHMTFLRKEFQAQVPEWLPVDEDIVVVLSGGVEILLGTGMILWKGRRVYVGTALAIFFILIFPGNISQYVNKIDAFGLDTDQKRLQRLFFQPVLILWALWSSGSLRALRGND